jgi:cyclic pyranopterin phosphate synthase
VRLYRFEDIDDTLKLLPLAARRALDAAGRKLSLSAWQRLPLERRRDLVTLGAAPVVDSDTVQATIVDADPPAQHQAVVTEPGPDPLTSNLDDHFDAFGGVPDAVWSALSPLDRYVLFKLSSRGRLERLQAAYDEIVGHSGQLTHVSPGGGARMVDVGQKAATARRARAESWVSMNQEAYRRLSERDVPKGDALGAARIAGILAAKSTPELVPLCHPLNLTRAEVEFELRTEERRVRVVASVDVVGQTGVEMEALTAASVAALTLYDMLKSFDRALSIGPTRLIEKTGGRSGDYRA